MTAFSPRSVDSQNQELEILLDLARAFNTGNDQGLSPVSDRLGFALERLCVLAQCDGALLFLKDEGRGGALRVFATSEAGSEFRGLSLEANDGLAGLVVTNREPSIQNDYPNWERRSAIFARSSSGLAHRVCAAPVVWRESVLGVVSLFSRSGRDPFHNEHVALLMRFASSAALGMQDLRDRAFRQALIERGPSAIVATNTRGEITEFNAQATTVFGHLRSAVLGRKAELLYWSGENEAARIETMLRENGRVEMEVFGRTAKQEKIPLTIDAAVLIEGEDIVGSAIVVEDLRLNALRGRHQRLVDAIGELNRADRMTDLLDLISLHAADLLYADASCIFVKLGDLFAPTATLNLSEELVSELGSEPFLRHLAQVAERGEPSIGRSWQGPPSSQIPEDATRSIVLVPIKSENGAVAVLVAASKDIRHFESDRRLLEVLASQAAGAIARLQLTAEKEAALEQLLLGANAITVGNIATGFIHETKNLLGIVRLIANNLVYDIRRESSLDEKQKQDFVERLGSIEAEVARMNDLALRLERFAQYGLRPSKSEVYLNSIVRSTMELLASTLRSKSLKLDERYDAALDQPSHGQGHPLLLDATQIQQGIMNLVLNAVAASPPRGRIIVQTRCTSEHVEVHVTDYGEGIHDEHRRQLFTPFFTTKKEGTGLGLYITKQLIEKNHSGSIEIGSQGKGATFIIKLPRTEASDYR
jgi:PAS domain S-box-containing protein